jgi:hypothetical protein
VSSHQALARINSANRKIREFSKFQNQKEKPENAQKENVSSSAKYGPAPSRFRWPDYSRISGPWTQPLAY